jgi:glycolate oxidase iron-sulfur subunit
MIMQTHFSPEQLTDPKTADANQVLRSCVHCGFCTATCPTYVLLGDELDSPRGRIYLMKDMLEKGGTPSPDVVKHVDRCLSCLSCMTTCPSGVNYMHLVDHARVHIEQNYSRALPERLMRNVLGYVMPRPRVFRWAMRFGRLARPFRDVVRTLGFKRLAAALALVPKAAAQHEPIGQPGMYAAEGKKLGRVGLLHGCVQSVTDPNINAATIHLLTRLGFEVVVSDGESCCGSLTHHMGRDVEAHGYARRMIEQWSKAELDHIIITASGCGTVIKDYGHMLKYDVDYAAKAASVSAKAKDIAEFLATLNLPQLPKRNVRVAYHSACSMQHGQKITQVPISLLQAAGFEVVTVPEGHLCCGSAGTYNMMQPDIAEQLKLRKLKNIAQTEVDIVAAGNLGCITQLQDGVGKPMLHTVELLDWAYGGQKPRALGDLNS